MTGDNEKTNTAADAAATLQERARRDRVRLVRRLSKWLTRADSMAQDAAKMKRDGVTVPDGWPFAFADFFTLTGALRKYITVALQGATDPNAARPSAWGSSAEPMPFGGCGR